MKLTHREWVVLDEAMSRFVNDEDQRRPDAKRILTCKQVIAENLMVRFGVELVSLGGKKP